jgi:Holliday junction resolvase RusA-like endonuclease
MSSVSPAQPQKPLAGAGVAASGNAALEAVNASPEHGRTLTLALPLPPGINASYANASCGRVATPKLKAWKQTAATEIAHQVRGVQLAGTYRLAVLASDQGLNRERDCDGLLKALIDAIVQNRIVIDDSYRFMRAAAIAWEPSLPPGRCTVTLSELTGEPIAKPAKAPRRAAKRDLLTTTHARAKVPASIMAALRKRGINVDASRVRL